MCLSTLSNFHNVLRRGLTDDSLYSASSVSESCVYKKLNTLGAARRLAFPHVWRALVVMRQLANTAQGRRLIAPCAAVGSLYSRAWGSERPNGQSWPTGAKRPWSNRLITNPPLPAVFTICLSSPLMSSSSAWSFHCVGGSETIVAYRKWTTWSETRT